jgi:hypothetical protein
VQKETERVKESGKMRQVKKALREMQEQAWLSFQGKGKEWQKDRKRFTESLSPRLYLPQIRRAARRLP